VTDLGTVLRAWRDRLSPDVVGLPTGRRRRSPGLRREELAMLAGVSADYLTRLEQGRADNPSAQVLEALARALQCSAEERDYLFRVAGQQPPGAGRVPSHLTPGVQRLLRRLDESPVSVHDAAWNIVAWNHAWTSLMGDASSRTGRDRNLLWRHFTGATDSGATGSGAPPSGDTALGDSGVRVVRGPAETEAFEASAVGDLRAAAARYPGDERLRALVQDLRKASPRFRELWDSGVVGTHVSEVKVIEHPEVGRLALDCDILTVHGADLRVVVYSAEPGSETAEKLAMLRVVGLQRLG
jgi:transcriptional regulator with XRE-family HTH domain